MIKECLSVKKIYICIVCIMFSVLSFFLCGCNYTKIENDRVTVEMICNYLEKKYDDKFSLIEISQGVDGGRNLEVLLRSEKFPDDEIIANAAFEGYHDAVVGDDVIKVPRYIYEDNYVAYKYRSEFMKLISEYTQEIYGECKVCYTVPDRTLPDGMGDLSFDFYITSSNSGLAYTIFLPPSAYSDDFEEKMESLYKKYAENWYQIDANVYYLSRQEDYDGITNENYYDKIIHAHSDKEWYIVFGYYHLDGAGNAYCEWREAQKQDESMEDTQE